MKFNKKTLAYFIFLVIGYCFGSWNSVEPPQLSMEEWSDLFGEKSKL